MYNKLPFLLCAALLCAPITHSLATSSSMLNEQCTDHVACTRDLQAELDAYQEWVAFERSLENHPNPEVKVLVSGIEQDIIVVTQLMIETVQRVIDSNKVLITEECETSVEPLIQLAIDMGNVAQHVNAILYKEILIESERDMMQQGHLDLYFYYMYQKINECILMFDFIADICEYPAHMAQYEHAMNPSFQAAVALFYATDFAHMSPLSQVVFTESMIELKNALPAMHDRCASMLDKSQRLITLTQCATVPYVVFMDERMHTVCEVYRCAFMSYMQHNVVPFEDKVFEDLSQEEVTQLFDFAHNITQECINASHRMLSTIQ